MEKEFEALQKFLDDYLALCEKLHTNQQEKMLLDENSPYNVLKQVLTELKAIKEAKPSEALRCLEELRSNLGVIYDDTLNAIEQALLKAQEQDKALEIIKEKDVDTFYLRQCFKVKDGLEKYNNCFKVGYKLKEEEFDLLKRWIM